MDSKFTTYSISPYLACASSNDWSVMFMICWRMSPMSCLRPSGPSSADFICSITDCWPDIIPGTCTEFSTFPSIERQRCGCWQINLHNNQRCPRAQGTDEFLFVHYRSNCKSLSCHFSTSDPLKAKTLYDSCYISQSVTLGWRSCFQSATQLSVRARTCQYLLHA